MATKFRYLFTVVLFFVIAIYARGADETKLEPNARWHLFFPDLPETLATMGTGEKHPTQLTVRLPANYSRAGKFPLFVFLNGDDGGFGDRLPLDRRTCGTNDFICVNLPLFKCSYTGTNDTKIITMDDCETMSRAYRIMLQKLFDTVPNITPERSALGSALGGFSNGAHAVGVLLARQDDFLLQHFRSFYLIEGGFGPFAASVATPAVSPALKRSRFLLMYGDTFLSADDADGAKMHDHLARACVLSAKLNHIDLTSIVMKGFGHELPPEYNAWLGRWVRGEEVPETTKEK
jgi:hypothetical protein